MTKIKSTKRALLLSGLALLTCVAMLVGSTYAWFTDSVTSSGNKIVSGNLDIELWMHNGTDYIDISDSSAPIFGASSVAQNNNAATLWEPGKTQVAYLYIKNAGNLALKYTVALDVEDISSDLYEVMQYAITPDAKNGDVTEWVAANGEKVIPGIQTVTDGDIIMEPGDTHYFALSIHMDEQAGNKYQNGEVEFDLTVLATQATVEEDSFNNQYDKDATYPELVSNAAELKAALSNADVREIVFSSDVALDEAVKVTTDKVIDFNGNDFTAKSGSRPFQTYGADITIDAIGSNVALDKYGLVDIKEGDDVKISITGGTFTGELDNGAVFKGRANTHAEIYLKDVNMSFTDSSTSGSYVYNPVKSASATTIVDGGVYNIDCGFTGNVTIKNATINAKGFAFNGGGSIENSTLTTDGSSKAPFDAAPFCCIAATNGRTVTVKNSTLTATNCNAIEVYPSGGTVTVVGSTVNGACYKHALDANHQDAVVSITIDGVEQ